MLNIVLLALPQRDTVCVTASFLCLLLAWSMLSIAFIPGVYLLILIPTESGLTDEFMS